MKATLHHKGGPTAVDVPDSILSPTDQKKSSTKEYRAGGDTYRITAHVRYGDSCRNGHNTLSITGDIDRKVHNGRWADDSGGCIHNEIAHHFASLREAIPFHLCSTEGPMHYISNTLYHASNRDHYGHLAGEVEAYRYNVRVNGALLFDVTGKRVHTLPDKDEAEAMADRIGGEIVPVPWIISKGKGRDLDAARRSAIWPEATDEEIISATPEILAARLPEIMAKFKAIVEGFGFTY